MTRIHCDALIAGLLAGSMTPAERIPAKALVLATVYTAPDAPPISDGTR